VAGVVIGGASDEKAVPIYPFRDERSIWPNFVIGLDDTIDRRPAVPLEKSPGMSGAAEAIEKSRAVIDQVFEQRLPAARKNEVPSPHATARSPVVSATAPGQMLGRCALFMPLLALGNYLAQKRSIRRQLVGMHDAGS
jgi:hypothetical protein